MNAILKSEIVEKNDGKASYIIKKLFEAYLTNPHQLPDNSLIAVWNLFIEMDGQFIWKIPEDKYGDFFFVSNPSLHDFLDQIIAQI